MGMVGVDEGARIDTQDREHPDPLQQRPQRPFAGVERSPCERCERPGEHGQRKGRRPDSAPSGRSHDGERRIGVQGPGRSEEGSDRGRRHAVLVAGRDHQHVVVALLGGVEGRAQAAEGTLARVPVGHHLEPQLCEPSSVASDADDASGAPVPHRLDRSHGHGDTFDLQQGLVGTHAPTGAAGQDRAEDPLALDGIGGTAQATPP